MRVCEFHEQIKAILARLKLTACPHCKRVGNLIRHGYVRGYDEKHPRDKTVRAWRIFCSNRKRATGCGRTFSVWLADKVKRLLLTADALWTFLKRAVVTGNKFQAFPNLNSGLSDSAPYRIWKRFLEAQTAIRTALSQQCEAAEGDVRAAGGTDARSSRSGFRISLVRSPRSKSGCKPPSCNGLSCLDQLVFRHAHLEWST
jgi:hypothetical protein